MPTMQQDTFGGRVPPGPAGELKHSPGPLAAMGTYFYVKGREGKEREKGGKGEMKERGGKEKERARHCPP